MFITKKSNSFKNLKRCSRIKPLLIDNLKFVYNEQVDEVKNNKKERKFNKNKEEENIIEDE